MTLPELLAPAGDYDILVTAINAGAKGLEQEHLPKTSLWKR